MLSSGKGISSQPPVLSLAFADSQPFLPGLGCQSLSSCWCPWLCHHL